MHICPHQCAEWNDVTSACVLIKSMNRWVDSRHSVHDGDMQALSPSDFCCYHFVEADQGHGDHIVTYIFRCATNEYPAHTRIPS